ncbi:MAG: hypothetical protein UV20_C0028G0005 [Candidatus Magasanikbacteria bacterium GW2011_GWA2_42_32]|uniref:Uncharacterized protein n=1 Tax=Candidatus Magasanikbacteria bacterium GW2011_GWA2_42_32 TaxID=1619039 RepID=A0A0G1A1Y9_9BACT|nr:MAG: hypothetical protein UV20_C0028G0005 [Candidatus Magasanikbacteria bacterium GW2011_GWA2_42_32]
MDNKTKGFDGSDEIIYSESFNIYEGKLIIPDFLGKKFTFVFEKTEPTQDQKDINITWSTNDALITFSKKFRNVLGSGTSNKIKILKTGDGKNISLSVYGQQFGEDGLSVVVNFYVG